MKELLHQYSNSILSVFYLLDRDTGLIGLTLLPSELDDRITVNGKWKIENLVQLKLVGDDYPDGFAQGVTLRNSQSCEQLKYESQQSTYIGGTLTVTTVLRGPRVSAVHTLTLPAERAYAQVQITVQNTSDSLQKLEMLSSFSLCGLSPIEPEERMKDLSLLRLQSRWSAEGKLLRQSLTDLHMEPSWSHHGVSCQRWGQVGSMPVRGYFPWGGVKDEKYGFITGAQLYHPGSWQMELYERDDKAALSGGLADRELGHWLKELVPGETFAAPQAVIASCMGDADELGYQLTLAQSDRLNVPAGEEDLPIIFNEYCTTWGNPTEENLKQIIKTIQGKGFRYLVIDAGWYSIGHGPWYDDQGDWNVSSWRFPSSMRAATKAIREAGMIPGIWFELECINKNAEAYKLTDWQLSRDEVTISDNTKHFWDMRNEQVIRYLDKKVIAFLKENGFGYIKVDYNGNIGIGADGCESQGEALRQCVLSSQDFFRRMRRELPELVIENCASGGHRLEPSMMSVCSMASFSDAHECVTIPVIAAQLHRAILPRQSQIWAVVRASDSERRLVYSLTAAMLGRLCLSGDVYDLTEAQWSVIDRATAFYKQCAPVIAGGMTRISGDEQADWSHLSGCQIVLREGRGDAENLLMVVLHRFTGEGEIRIPLPEAGYRIKAAYTESNVEIHTETGELVVCGMEAMSGTAVLLEK